MKDEATAEYFRLFIVHTIQPMELFIIRNFLILGQFKQHENFSFLFYLFVLFILSYITFLLVLYTLHLTKI